MNDSTAILFTDGGSRGNPGPAGIGAVLTDSSGAVIDELKECIGPATNNIAEYTALERGLALAQKHGVQILTCRLDSELVVRQLNREYKVKDLALQKAFLRVWNLSQTFKRIVFTTIPREKNAHADRLVNEALDAK